MEKACIPVKYFRYKFRALNKTQQKAQHLLKREDRVHFFFLAIAATGPVTPPDNIIQRLRF